MVFSEDYSTIIRSSADEKKEDEEDPALG
jgi:hypothetical protein